MNHPSIQFYIPSAHLRTALPTTPQQYWAWRVQLTQPSCAMGAYDWTLQTFLYLHANQFACELTDSPADGIIVAHRDYLPDHWRPTPQQLLVCLKADRLVHPYAQAHIIQNPSDPVQRRKQPFTPNCFIRHWLQPQLVGRDPNRGDRFETIAYFGSSNELDPAFQTAAWHSQLRELGFNWVMATAAEQWTDYSAVDALVAVRQCGARLRDFRHKPATKLYTAWRVGVPAILGRETAYRSEARPDLDYLEANSPQAVLAALQRLRQQPQLRQLLRDNGQQRAGATTPAAIVQSWKDFFLDTAIPSYYRWRRSAWERRRYFVLNSVKRNLHNNQRRLTRTARALLQRQAVR